MKIKHDGLRTNRLHREPLERIFADEWAKLNASVIGGNVLLDHVLAVDANHPKGEVKQRDATVAATVIQWLGTHVGQGFLRRVEERARDEA